MRASVRRSIEKILKTPPGARATKPRFGSSIVDIIFSPKQKALAKKHGTPEEFAVACYAAVPSFISMDEAEVAIRKYRIEWDSAARDKED